MTVGYEICDKSMTASDQLAPLRGPRRLDRLEGWESSPRRTTRNIALAMVSLESADKQSELIVYSSSGDRPAKVVDVPFIDRKKQLVKSPSQ